MFPGSSPCLLTDFYQLTMAQAYLKKGKANQRAIFNLFCRNNPFAGNFMVAAGIKDAIEFINQYSFDDHSLGYLRSLKNSQGKIIFDEDFLEFLKNISLKDITVRAVKEGSIIFPLEPILQLEGPLALLQLLETGLLNIINFQTLITSKAVRVVMAAGKKPVFEFGLRRAQGFSAGILASKCAYLAGALKTSNVWAANHFGIDPGGTMGHSFILSFAEELDAFASARDLYPDDCSLLIDTYGTMSGIKRAIPILKSLVWEGRKNLSVRIDSGDLLIVSKQVRQLLNEANLSQVSIIASGDLDEVAIQKLNEQGAPIDAFGVGTKMVTGDNQSSLSMVYKLSALYEEGKLRAVKKISDTPQKTSLSGQIHFVRFLKNGEFSFDILTLKETPMGNWNVDRPFDESQVMLSTVFNEGICLLPQEEYLEESRRYLSSQIAMLPKRLLQLKTCHSPYPVLMDEGI